MISKSDVTDVIPGRICMKHPEICFEGSKTKVPIKVYKKTVMPITGRMVERKIPADDDGYYYYNETCEKPPKMQEILIRAIIPPGTEVRLNGNQNDLSCQKMFVKNQQYLENDSKPHVSYSFTGCINTLRQSGYVPSTPERYVQNSFAENSEPVLSVYFDKLSAMNHNFPCVGSELSCGEFFKCYRSN